MNWLCAFIVVFACIKCACMLLFYFRPYAHLEGSRNKQTSTPKTSPTDADWSATRRGAALLVLHLSPVVLVHWKIWAMGTPTTSTTTWSQVMSVIRNPIHNSDTYFETCICRSLRLWGTLTIQSCSSTSSLAPRRSEEYSSKFSQVQITLNLATYAFPLRLDHLLPSHLISSRDFASLKGTDLHTS